MQDWGEDAPFEMDFRLGEAERIVLSAVIRKFGLRDFTMEELERLAVPLRSEAAKQAAFLMLRRKGVVLTMKKMWGERVYVIPRRAFPMLRSLAIGTFPWQEAVMADCKPESAPAMPHGFSLSIFRLLQLAEAEGWTLTKQGSLPIKTVERAASRLMLREEALAHLPLTQTQQAKYPKAFALALDAAFRLGLLVVRANRLQHDPDRVNAWLALSACERERELIRLWHEVHLPEPAWLQIAAFELNELPPGVWVDLDSFVAWLMRLQPDGMPDRAAPAADMLRERWLRPLAACGWLTFGRSGDRSAFRMAALEQADEDWIDVLEDYEIIVPPDVSFRLRWELEAFCETVSSDEVTRLRLTRARVRQALEAGKDAVALLRLLEETSASGVPDNVRRSLAEWHDRMERVRFADVRLLRVSDPETAETFARHPELSRFLLERIGDCDFIVDPGFCGELDALLERIGYAPRRAVIPCAAANGPDPDSSRPKGIIQPAVPEPAYERDLEAPTWSALYPDMKQVPQIWLKELRAYHESTCKQLIRKAIEYRTSVRIRRFGQVAEVTALGLDDGRDGWCLQGALDGAEVRLKPEDWQEIQLILPGINDKTELIPHP
jgi:hypothetical protein